MDKTRDLDWSFGRIKEYPALIGRAWLQESQQRQLPYPFWRWSRSSWCERLLSTVWLGKNQENIKSVQSVCRNEIIVTTASFNQSINQSTDLSNKQASNQSIKQSKESTLTTGSAASSPVWQSFSIKLKDKTPKTTSNPFEVCSSWARS